MTRLAPTVQTLYTAFDVDAALRDVVELVRHDRYQASAGIHDAAAYVAEAAARAGLVDVEILRFPADTAVRWWTFQAPAGWTPRRAVLSLVHGATIQRELVAYPRQPYSLAAYSAPTPPRGVTAPLARLSRGAGRDLLAGAIVLADDPGVAWSRAVALAEENGALGLAVSTGRDAEEAAGAGHVGRVELAAGSPLFAFSVTEAHMAELADWSDAGGRAAAVVEVGSVSTMPVVTGRLPGGDDGEVLLAAHLCHPAPGANDNASGVAAALGVGRLLARRRRRRAVRFVWGPEFVGLAAWLHSSAVGGRAPYPLAAVVLDMVGEDQRRCGGPLIVERSPDRLPSFLNAVVEACMRALPQASRSYSGAVACDTWAWRATPFVGASDHALLADRAVGCPAVQLGHWPDRFNHSSADTLDKLDPQELLRAATVAAAAAATITEAGTDEVDDLEALVLRWAGGRILECLPEPNARPPLGPGWIDPLAPEQQPARVDHRREMALASTRALDSLREVPAAHPTERERWLEILTEHVRAAVPAVTGPAEAARSREGIAASWAGPFNLRGLLGVARPADRVWIEDALAHDRGRNYATMLALAQSLSDGVERRAAMRSAALEADLPIEVTFGERFLDILLRAGWARKVPAPHGIAG